jgi:hypothetical protein
MIYINDLYFDKKSQERYRIIAFDASVSNIALIGLKSKVAVPKWYKLSTIEALIAEKIFNQVDDPSELRKNVSIKFFDDEKLTEAERNNRDYSYRIAEDGWFNRKYELLDKNTRNSVYQDLANKYNVTEDKVKRIFTRFWQRGMSPNALLPDYRFSGGPNKGKNSKTDGKKLGMPKKIRNGMKIEGIRITAEVRGYIEEALRLRFYNKKKRSYKDSYDYMLEKHYSKFKKINPANNKAYYDPNFVPEYNTFLYHAHKFEKKYELIVKREGLNVYNKNFRPLFDNSYADVLGPGEKYQVDATIADLEIVSSITGNPIGRPVIYCLIDIFSRLITAVYVSLAPESWIGISVLLLNMIQDKVEFCRSFGIEITEEQWPSHHLPNIILGDNGAFVGKAADNLVKNYGIQMEYAASYRGDLKGIVERQFKIYNDYTKHNFPGAVLSYPRLRGEKKPADSAYYSLEGFTKSIILLIIEHNNSIVMELDKPRELIENKVPSVPTQMWKWGIENKTGRLKTVLDTDWFQLCTLPSGKATITQEGISFKKMRYTCDRFVNEHWEVERLGEEVEVVFDPRMTKILYLVDKNNFVDVCELIPADKRDYDDCYLAEIEERNNELVDAEYQGRLEKTASGIDTKREIDKIDKEEKRKTELRRQMIESNMTGTAKEKKRKEREQMREINDIAESPLPYISDEQRQQLKEVRIENIENEKELYEEYKKRFSFLGTELDD